MPPLLIIDHKAKGLPPTAQIKDATILTLPIDPPTMASWQDFFTWLQEHPEIVAMIVTAILALLGAASTRAKDA